MNWGKDEVFSVKNNIVGKANVLIEEGIKIGLFVFG